MIADMTSAIHHKRMGPKFAKWRKQGQMDRSTWAESRRTWASLPLHPRRIRRRGRRFRPRGGDLDRRQPREFGQLGTRHPLWDRGALHSELRHGRAKGTLVAKDGHRRIGRRAGDDGTLDGSDVQAIKTRGPSGGQFLPPLWAKDIHHQRPAR